MDRINSEEREEKNPAGGRDSESGDLGLLMIRLGRIKELILAITAFQNEEQK